MMEPDRAADTTLVWKDVTPLRERATLDAAGGRCRCIVISEGRGASAVYPAHVLRASVEAGKWEGLPAHIDHPSADEDRSRPERSVTTLCGQWRNATAESIDGKLCVVADLHFASTPAGRLARELVETALGFDRQAGCTPGEACTTKPFVGISLCGSGRTSESTIEGERVYVADRADVSDIVTQPGREGRPLGPMRESKDGWTRVLRALQERGVVADPLDAVNENDRARIHPSRCARSYATGGCAAQLGHHSPSFTLDRYGHLMPRNRRGLVNRLDALAAPAGTPGAPATGTTVSPDAHESEKPLVSQGLS